MIGLGSYALIGFYTFLKGYDTAPIDHIHDL